MDIIAGASKLVNSLLPQMNVHNSGNNMDLDGPSFTKINGPGKAQSPEVIIKTERARSEDASWKAKMDTEQADETMDTMEDRSSSLHTEHDNQQPIYRHQTASHYVEIRDEDMRKIVEDGTQTRLMNRKQRKRARQRKKDAIISLRTFMPSLLQNMRIVHESNLGRKFAALEADFGTIAAERDELIERLERAKQDHKSEIHDLRSELQAKQARIKDLSIINRARVSLNSEDAQLREENTRLKKQCTTAQHKLEEYENQLRQDVLEHEELSIRQAQDHAFNQLDKAEWIPREVDKLRHDLDSLERRLREWAKKYTRHNIEDWDWALLSDEDLKNLYQQWAAFALIEDDSPIALRKRKFKDKAWIYVAAWVIRDVYTRIFDDPLDIVQQLLSVNKGFIADAGSRVGSDSNTFCDFFDILSQVAGVDEGKVHDWRAATVRLVVSANTAASEHQSHDGNNRFKEILDAAVLEVATHVTTEFLTNAWGFANFGTDENSSFDELVMIISGAVRLSLELATQRSRLDVVSQELLDRAYGQGRKYTEVDRLHSREVDEDENALDNHWIIFVTHPAVVMTGDSEGVDRKVERVLKKASVLVARVE